MQLHIKNNIYTILILSLLLIRSVSITAQTTHTVMSTGDTPGTAVLTLRQAVSNAADGDKINFDASINQVTLESVNGPILINDLDVTIEGNILNNKNTIISGDGTADIFDISNNSEVNFSKVNITQGKVAIKSNSSSIDLLMCNIHDNTNTGCGAGILGVNTNLDIKSSSIYNNTSVCGSAIKLTNFDARSFKLYNSTVDNNEGTGVIGALDFNFQAQPTEFWIDFCTITRNTNNSTGFASAIWIENSTWPVEIKNSIVYGNGTGIRVNAAGEGPISSKGYNIFEQSVSFTVSTDIIGLDPLLGALDVSGAVAFVPISQTGAAFDASGDCTLIDQSTATDAVNGISRPTYCLCDIGAVEFFDQPYNDICTNAITIAEAADCANPVFGTTICAAQNQVWYTFTPSSTGTYTFESYNTINNGNSSILVQDNCNGNILIGLIGKGNVSLSAGTSYLVSVQTIDNDFSPIGAGFTFCVYPCNGTPVNDICSGAIDLTVGSGQCSSKEYISLSCLTKSSFANFACSSFNQGIDVWFKAVVPATGVLTINTEMEGDDLFGNSIIAFSSCDPDDYIDCVSYGPQAIHHNALTITNQAVGSTVYFRVFAVTDVLTYFIGSINVCAYDCAPPSNFGPCGATVITESPNCTTTYSGSTFCDDDEEVWYKYVGTSSETIQIEVTNLIGGDNEADIDIHLTDPDCNNLDYQFDSDNFIVLNPTQGQVYYISVEPDDPSTFDLCISACTPPSNNEACTATVITESPNCTTTYSGSTFCEVDEEVWYKYVSTSSETVQIEVTNLIGGGNEAYIEIYIPDPDCDNLDYQLDNDNVIVFNPMQGQVYYISVEPDNPSTFDLCIFECTAPDNIDPCEVNLPVITESTSCIQTAGTTVCTDYVYYKFIPDQTTRYAIESSSTAGNPSEIYIYDACDLDNSVADGYGFIQVELTQGQAYFIEITTLNQYEDNISTGFNICVYSCDQAPSNDLCANAFPLSVDPSDDCVSAYNQIYSCVSEGGPTENDCGSYDQPGDVWFKLVVPQTGIVTIETFGDGSLPGSFEFDTVLEAYTVGSGTGAECSNLVYEDCNDDSDIDNTLYSLLELSGLVPGSMLYIKVFNFDNFESGSFNICARTDPNYCPPSLDLSGDIVVGSSHTYESDKFDNDGSISSDQLITGATTNIEYSAGKTVELNAGFEVGDNAVFHAYIDGCLNYSFTPDDGEQSSLFKRRNNSNKKLSKRTDKKLRKEKKRLARVNKSKENID